MFVFTVDVFIVVNDQINIGEKLYIHLHKSHLEKFPRNIFHPHPKKMYIFIFLSNNKTYPNTHTLARLAQM